MAIGEIKAAPPRRTRGWSGWRLFRVAGYLAAVLFVVIALAPTIISWTGLRHALLQRATAGLPVTVAVQDLSIGWLTPVTLEGIAIKGPDGSPLATIPKIETERTLLGLAISRKDLGKIKIERPELDVVFSDNTSNLEKIFQQSPDEPAPPAPSAPAPSSPSAPPKFILEIVDGLVRVKDQDASKEWKVERINGIVTHDAAVAQSLSGRLQANVTGDGEPGSLDLLIKEAKSRPRLEGLVQVEAKSLPVSLVGPIIRRAYPEMSCTGRLQMNAMVRGYLTPDRTAVITMNGLVDARDLEAAGGPLGPDRFAIRRASMPISGTYNGYQIQITKAELECDIGKASARGRLDLGSSMLASLGEPGTELKVDVDLKEIADRLPNTLKLHKDVRLTGGKLHLDGKSVAVNNGSAWNANLTTSDIRGLRGATQVSWDDPLSIAFKVRQSSPSVMPEVEELRCRSKFLTVDADVGSRAMNIEAVANLGELATSLGQFVDLGSWGIAGRATASIKIKREQVSEMAVDGKAMLEGFQWGPWREQKLDVTVNGLGHKLDATKLKLDKGVLRVTGGKDDLEITLREPVLLTSSTPESGAIHVRLDGELANWQQRLKTFSTFVADTAVRGQGACQVWLTFSPNRFESRQIVSAKNLDLTYGSFRVVDPEMNIDATILYDSASQVVDMKPSNIKGQALTLFTDRFKVDMKKKSMAGQITFLGDLARLQDWMPKTPGVPPSPDRWAGSAWGKADLRAGDDGFDIEVKSDIKGLAFGPAGRPKISDPHVTVFAKGRYDGPKGILGLDALQVNSQMGVVDARAQLAKIDTTMDVDIKGTLGYDLIQVQPLLRAYLGAGARIEGKDRREFHLVGPLRPRGAKSGIEFASLEGSAGANWTVLFGYGADIGPADIKANLKGGSLRFDPIATSINGGRLTLSPLVRLDPAPYELTLPAGPVVEGAKVTPQLCASALGYTLPAIANVAQAEGELSVRLDSARVPLGEPNKSQVLGSVTLHHARVSAGPILGNVMALMKVDNTLSFIRENQINVKMENGRVYHDSLELVFPENFTIKTKGSVGLDGSLDMIAEMPIPAKLLGNLKLPVNVARHPIMLPIGGTVERPAIDGRALEGVLRQLARDAARDAAGDLIKQGLEDRLKKFLQPK